MSDTKIPRDSSPNHSDVTNVHSIPTSLRKQKKEFVDDHDGLKRTQNVESSERENAQESRKKQKVVEVPLIAIRPPPLAFPKSLYHGHVNSIPQSSERNVLQGISVGGNRVLMSSTKTLNSWAGQDRSRKE